MPNPPDTPNSSAVQPRDLARALSQMPPSARRLVEEAVELHLKGIERLIQACDEMDGDPNLEPSLGWTDLEAGTGCEAVATFPPDLEEEHDGREPSLCG